jgi:hypothetical protein
MHRTRLMKIGLILICVAIGCGRGPVSGKAAEVPAGAPPSTGNAEPVITLTYDTAAGAPEPFSGTETHAKLIADFESMEIGFGGSIGVYGGAEPNWADPGPKSWFVVPGEVEYDPAWVHGGRQSFRIKWNPKVHDWATFAILLGPMFKGEARPRPADLGRYRRLVFWARGEKGNETFRFIARSREAPSLDADLPGLTYMANPAWTRYDIDLKELFGSRTQIEMVGIQPGEVPLDEGVLYTDDWELIP